VAAVRSGSVTNPGLPPSPGAAAGPRLRGGSCTAEAPVTLVLNLILFGAIALVPLGISFVFMRLRRKFSSYS
jgi:hypothetical protein